MQMRWKDRSSLTGEALLDLLNLLGGVSRGFFVFVLFWPGRQRHCWVVSGLPILSGVSVPRAAALVLERMPERPLRHRNRVASPDVA